jgi:hypothetical protein
VTPPPNSATQPIAPRNLIFFNHLPKTGGMAVQKLIRDAHKTDLVPLVEVALDGQWNAETGRRAIATARNTRDRFLYAAFHPANFTDKPEVQALIHDRSISFSVLRRPSDVFASFVRYFYRCSQHPNDFAYLLKTRQILPIADPNQIFDLCLEELGRREQLEQADQADQVDQIDKADQTQKSAQTEKPKRSSSYLFQYLRCLRATNSTSLATSSRTLAQRLQQPGNITTGDIRQALRRDYFALCTIERLDQLLAYFKHLAIVPADAQLERINTSRNDRSIPLSDDRREIIDRQQRTFDYNLWHWLRDHGSFFNPELFEQQRQRLQPLTSTVTPPINPPINPSIAQPDTPTITHF